MSSSSSSSSSINPIASANHHQQPLPKKPSTTNTNQTSSNSNSFARSSFQSFGRVGDHPQPSPSPGLFNTNHHLSNVKKNLSQLNLNQQQSSIGNQSPNRPRKLGSFNSLAVNSAPLTTANNISTTNHHSISRNQHQHSPDDRSASADIHHQHHLTDEPVDSTIDSKPIQQVDNQQLLISNLLHPQHKLRSKWVFWLLHRLPSQKISEEEFGRAMRRLGSCDTVETFYSLYLHIKRPSTHLPITDLHIFIDPIKPAWEDPMNVNGGRWTIRLKKGLANRLWETLMFSLIGGGLEKLICNNSHHHQQNSSSDDSLNDDPDRDHQNNKDPDFPREICGAVLSIRRDEDILAVWHKTGSSESGGDGKMAKQVKLSLQTVLQLPLNCNLSYKLNATCLSSTTGHHLGITKMDSITTTGQNNLQPPTPTNHQHQPQQHSNKSNHHHQHQHQPNKNEVYQPPNANGNLNSSNVSKSIHRLSTMQHQSSNPNPSPSPNPNHSNHSNSHHQLPSLNSNNSKLHHQFGNPSIGNFGNLGSHQNSKSS